MMNMEHLWFSMGLGIFLYRQVIGILVTTTPIPNWQSTMGMVSTVAFYLHAVTNLLWLQRIFVFYEVKEDSEEC